MQKCNALNSIALGIAVRARLFVTATFVALSLHHAVATARAATAARTLRSRCAVIGARRMTVRTLAAILLRGSGMSRTLTARCAAILLRQCDADQLFDVAQITQFLTACHEGDCGAVGTGARGAANTVDVGFGNVCEIEVDDVTDAIDVDAACGDVGGNKSSDFAGAECSKDALTMVLRLVAVDGLGGNAGFHQSFHNLVGTVFGAREHQRAVNVLGLEKLSKNCGLG